MMVEYYWILFLFKIMIGYWLPKNNSDTDRRIGFKGVVGLCRARHLRAGIPKSELSKEVYRACLSVHLSKDNQYLSRLS